MNTFKLLLIVFVIALEFCFQTVKCSTIQEVRKAFQETAYSYYMKSKWIQYNHYKAKFFSPEEVTSQNVNFLVCSAFVSSVYKELLDITVPGSTKDLLSYAINKTGSPEVVAYSPAYTTGKRIMYFYPNSTNITEVHEPSMNDIFDHLESGDILTYSGHTFLIYNTVTNWTSNTKTDAIFIEVTSGTGSYVNSKINKTTVYHNGLPYGGDSRVLFLNTVNDTNIELGAVYIDYLSKNRVWNEINNSKYKKIEYSILRFIHEGENSEAILKYSDLIDKPDQIANDSTINLNDKNLDRKDFSHLYIEKTVDKFNGNIVEIGETLVYKIIVKNKALKLNYTRDLVIVENLSEFVEFQRNYTSNTVKSFEYNSTDRKLIWNIGQLNKGDEVIIEYSVIVTNGSYNSIIVSTGTVGNISSSTIKNVIGNNLDIYKQNAIKMAYDNLKNKSISGKELINRIYSDTLGVELNLTEFNIEDLIEKKKYDSISYSSINLNDSHKFYNIVLNNYWSSMSIINYPIDGNKTAKVYDLKDFRKYSDEKRRQDFIYPETFRTGDILIYTNYDDKIYLIGKNKNKTITYENGEYAYIYIDGKGFVGVNYENENRTRNEFTPKYYYENYLPLFQNDSSGYGRTFKNGTYNDEIGNLQTLFGKDYYVILRPSLKFHYDFKRRRLSGKSGGNLLKVENKNSQGGYFQFKVLKLVKYILWLLL